MTFAGTFDIIVGSALRTMSTLGTTFVNPSRIEFEMTASADGAAGQIILSYIGGNVATLTAVAEL